MSLFKSKKNIQRKALFANTTSFELREAYKTSRTNLQAVMDMNGYKVLAVSSSDVGEGKTTFAINMAMSLAFTGAKVLLIDCDLRKPRIHKYLKLNKSYGISDILIFNKGVDVIQKVGEEKLHVLTAGTKISTPVEMLTHKAMKELIQKFREMYDFVVIDTPPAGFLADATVVSQTTDAVVLVVKQDGATRKTISKTLEAFNKVGGNVIGVILNEVHDWFEDKYYNNNYYNEYYEDRSKEIDVVLEKRD